MKPLGQRGSGLRLRGSLRRSSLALGLAAALFAGAAIAQQPGSQPMPPGHPPVGAPPGAAPTPPGAPPGARPNPQMQPGLQPMPNRGQNIQPGRPIGPGGQPIRPGHGGLPFPGGRNTHAGRGEASEESRAHGEGEHCPGHGPTNPPPHVNWWHGLIGVNNEAAGKGGLGSLLWRYQNDKDPCDPKNEPPPFLASVLNFGVLALILVRFGKKPIGEALKKRKESIMLEIDTASRLKEEAEQRLDDYEAKLERLEETLAELKAEYATQAEVEKAYLISEAEQRRVRMRRDAEFRIEQELKAARSLLLQEAVQSAVTAAEQLLRERIGTEDQNRVAEDYLQAIPAAVSGTTRAPQTTGAAT